MRTNDSNPFGLLVKDCIAYKGFYKPDGKICEFISRDFGIRAAYRLVFSSYRRKGIFSVRDVTELMYHGNVSMYEVFRGVVVRELSCSIKDVWFAGDVLDLDVAQFSISYLRSLSLAIGSDVGFKEIYDVVKRFRLSVYEFV